MISMRIRHFLPWIFLPPNFIVAVLPSYSATSLFYLQCFLEFSLAGVHVQVYLFSGSFCLFSALKARFLPEECVAIEFCVSSLFFSK